MPNDVEVTGIRELSEKIERLVGGRLEVCAYKALYEGALIEKQTIEANAPVAMDEPNATSTALPQGAVKADITVKRMKTAQNEPAYLVIPGERTAHVARWLEFGHILVAGGYRRAVKDKQGNKTGKFRGSGVAMGEVEPHPFLRRSWEEASAAVKERIAQVFAEELEKVSKNG